MNCKFFKISLYVVLLNAVSVLGAVSLTDSGGRVLLENGLVTVEIEKDTGYITLLKNGSKIYIDSDRGKGKGYSLPGTSIRPVVAMRGGQYSLVSSSGQMAEISITFADPTKWPLILKYHYFLRDGVRGFYQYLEMEYDPGFALEDEVYMEAIGYKYRVDPGLFTEGTIGYKNEIMPLPSELTRDKMVMDATYSIEPDSAWRQRYGKEYYTKYNYTNIREEFEVCGLSGGGYGLWLLKAGCDYLHSGPIHHSNAFHQTDSTPILLLVAHSVHFTSKKLYFNKSDGPWSKIYGPWFIYLNSGENREEMHQDAKNRYAVEQSEWPYGWCGNQLYPAANERGSVSGKVSMTDGTSPEGATVILSRKIRDDNDHWEGQGFDYIYYTNADEAGNFGIEDIRAATYTMYISMDGVFDEYRQDGISVTAGENNDIGAVSWKPARNGRKLWQIGTPDRRPSEFKHGDIYSDKWGLWYDYPTDFPDGVHFAIGQSNEKTDFNWAHCNVYTGNPEDGRWGISPWYIYFDLDEIPAGMCYLTIGICGNRYGVLNINVNNNDIETLDDIYSDGAYIRCGVRGYNQVFTVPIEQRYLKAGRNTLKLTQTNDYRYAGIYYDSILFEASISGDINKDGGIDIADLVLMSVDKN